MSPSPAPFEEWYRALHGRLVASVALAFGDVDLARDVADEAVARAWERWDRVGRMGSPEGWTYRVAVNVARRRRRREQIERALIRSRRPADDVPAPAGELWTLVADLPERQRLAVVLRHIGHLAEAEIAEVMGITRGGVSSTLRAAHRSLERQLADDRGGTGPAGVPTTRQEADR